MATTLRVALTYVGPDAVAGAKLGDNTHEYALAHGRLEPEYVLFKDGVTGLAKFMPEVAFYDPNDRKYVFTNVMAAADFKTAVDTATNFVVTIKFKLTYYGFFLRIVEQMCYAVDDTHNFADPVDTASITDTFTKVETKVKPTDKDWTVTFDEYEIPLVMTATLVSAKKTADTVAMALQLRSEDVKKVDKRMPVLQHIIATEWSAYYDDVTNNNKETTLNTAWRGNVKAFLLRYVPLTRGKKLMIGAVTIGWTACQTARDDGGLDDGQRQLNTLTALRNEIDRFLITSNPWGDSTNVGAYPTAVHIALAALYKRFRATPIGIVRWIEETKDLSASETMYMAAQMGMGNCAEHADITFKIIQSMMEKEADAKTMLRCVVRSGYFSIDHAFVTGGENPARIVNALIRVDNHSAGKKNERAKAWDSFAAVAPGAGPGRRGWICDPYLAIGEIDDNFVELGASSRRYQWLEWKGDSSIYPLAVIATVDDTDDATDPGHIHIVGICTQKGPTLTSIAPDEGPAGGGTTVTFTGTHFDSRVALGFGTKRAANVVFTDATTATGDTKAAAAGKVRALAIDSDEEPGDASMLADAFTFHDAPTITDVQPDYGSARGRWEVTISGTNFVDGKTTVQFDGKDGRDVTFVDTTSLTVKAPAHAAGVVPVSVSVTTPGGIATRNAGFTYRPAPTLTDIAPDSGPAKGGTTVTITGTDFQIGAKVWFDQTEVDAVLNNDQLTATTPPHAKGKVTVIVRLPDGIYDGWREGFEYT